MTKAQQILELYEQGHTTRVIAGIVYGIDDDASQTEWDRRLAYVRVVARQRVGRGRSEIDRRYKEANRPAINAYQRVWAKVKYHADPVWRERHLAAKAERWRRKKAERFSAEA